MKGDVPESDISDPGVALVFDNAEAPIREKLLELRSLIFEVARGDPRVGPLHETLKWGQPAYLTAETGSGTTVRIAPNKTGGLALFVHCQTSIIADFAAVVPHSLSIEGNRAVHLQVDEPLPKNALRTLIHSALTYHIA